MGSFEKKTNRDSGCARTISGTYTRRGPCRGSSYHSNQVVISDKEIKPYVSWRRWCTHTLSIKTVNFYITVDMGFKKLSSKNRAQCLEF